MMKERMTGAWKILKASPKDLHGREKYIHYLIVTLFLLLFLFAQNQMLRYVARCWPSYFPFFLLIYLLLVLAVVGLLGKGERWKWQQEPDVDRG